MGYIWARHPRKLRFLGGFMYKSIPTKCLLVSDHFPM